MGWKAIVVPSLVSAVVLLATVALATPPWRTEARTSGSSSIYLPAVANQPTSTPAPGYSDNFSNPNSGWPTTAGTDSSGNTVATRGYVNGTYQILFQQPGYDVQAGHNLLASDLQAQVEVWPAASTNGTIGLYFGLNSAVGYYDFEI